MTRYAINIDAGETDVRRIWIGQNILTNCRTGIVLAREEDGNDSGDDLVLEDIDIGGNIVAHMSRPGIHFQRHGTKDQQDIGYTTGWQITKAGNAEFNKLIARNSLQIGSVSEIDEVVAPQEVYVGNGVVAQSLSLGALPEALVQHAYMSWRFRRAGTTSGGYVRDTTVTVRYRFLLDGAMTDWETIAGPISTGSSFFQQITRIRHISGPYEQGEFQLRVTHDDLTFPVTNIKDVTLRVQSVIK